jgi:hypothetical protein
MPAIPVGGPLPVPAPPTEPVAPGTIGWALAGSSLRNLQEVNPVVAEAQLKNGVVFVTGPGDGNQFQVPPGWNSRAAVDYKSYAAFEADVRAGRVDSRITMMNYNPELWAGTPAGEQQDPYTFMKKFCLLAHSRGWQCTTAPARNLVAVPGSVCPQRTGEDRSQAYLRCDLPGAAARHADRVDIQGQIHQNDPSAYRDLAGGQPGRRRPIEPHDRVAGRAAVGSGPVRGSGSREGQRHRALAERDGLDGPSRHRFPRSRDAGELLIVVPPTS